MANINVSSRDSREDIQDDLNIIFRALEQDTPESHSAAAALLYGFAIKARQQGVKTEILRSTLDACNTLLGGEGKKPKTTELKTLAMLLAHILDPETNIAPDKDTRKSNNTRQQN